ncbi:hypothetical protein [Variovorax sp. W2I14]|uniref:hypothetical protein n=1 Tax=Variovorax sp. W2I14 TaxID=3042290 RepID=UPI003D228D97
MSTTKPQTVAIYMEGGSGNTATGNDIQGFDAGVMMVNETGSSANNNRILSAEAVQVFAQAEAAIAAAEMAELERDRLASLLANLKAESGRPGYAKKYMGFVSAVSAHVGLLPVLGPLFDILGQLGG